MKKILLVLFSVFVLANLLISCGETPSYPQDDDKDYQSGIYNVPGEFCETPTRVVFKGNSKLYYYNKLDGESYVFCFDPLCKHGDACISSKFIYASFIQPIVYNEYDNRLYALRGSKFVSMSFDGSDLKILYSFSDVDTLDDQTYDRTGCMYLQVFQNYAFMTALNEKTGNRDLYRYDIEKNEMICLTSKSKVHNNVEYFILDKDILCFWTMNAEQLSLYRSDLNFEHIDLVQPKIIGDFSDAIFDGENFYLRTMKSKLVDGYEVFYIDSIVAYNIKSNRQTTLCQFDHDNIVNLLAATDRYLYYNILDEIVLGTKKTFSGIREIENDHSKVYRYDMETGVTSIVLDDLTCQTNKLFLMKDQVIIHGKTFTIYENGVAEETLPYAMLADIDENGMFVNIRVLEE